MTSVPGVILDCGAHHLRAGYTSDLGPRLDVPTLVGHPRHRGVAMAAGMNELEVGEETLVKRGMLMVNRPIEKGVVQNWSDMEKLWSHIMFNELRVMPESHCFILTQPVDAPDAQKEKTLEVMMETFHVHSLFLGISQVLSLYSYGLTTGVTLDCGCDRALAVPVHEGYALGRHVTQSTVAGEVLTSYLGSLLREEGYSLGTAVERTLLNQAKENLCYVRPALSQQNHVFAGSLSRPRQIQAAPPSGQHRDHRNRNTSGSGSGNVKKSNSSAVNEDEAGGGAERDARSATSRSDADTDAADGVRLAGAESFVLPDGQAIPLTSHRWRTTEVLFNYSLLGDDALYEPPYRVFTEMNDLFVPSFRKGISWLPFAAINNCDAALRASLYANIVIAGSTLSFPGAGERIETEVMRLYRENHTNEAVTPIEVMDSECRGYSAWLGAAMLARTSMFEHLAVSRAEYDEEGLRVVHCKSL